MGERHILFGSAKVYFLSFRGVYTITQEAAIALMPSTTHPQSWHTYMYIQVPSVPPSPEEHNLSSVCPSTPASCRSSANDWSWLGHESSPYSFIYAHPRHLQHIPSPRWLKGIQCTYADIDTFTCSGEHSFYFINSSKREANLAEPCRGVFLRLLPQRVRHPI